MKIKHVLRSFKTQDQAIEYLEKVRWKGHPECPYCQSNSVCRHASGDRAGIRWQCQACTRAFSVKVGTIFHGTHVPLKNWFLLLGLMLNEEAASASQIARDVGMRRPTVGRMINRVRRVMETDPVQAELLYGIVSGGDSHDDDAKERKAPLKDS